MTNSPCAMFITRMRPYWRLRPTATSAYMPPVIRPATVRSIQRLTTRRRGARSPRRVLLPGRLREERGRGGAIGGPHHLELAFLPLADDTRCADVLAVLEADLADDRVELRR